MLEILAGSRRCAACVIAGVALRVQVHPNLTREAKVTEVAGSSHTVFLSHPDLVVSVIEEAAGR